MTSFMRLGSAVMVFAVLGCGSAPHDQGPVPLTVAEWKKLPVAERYTPQTFERLKAGDPTLVDAEGWEKFSRTVLIPQRLRDFPNGKNRS